MSLVPSLVKIMTGPLSDINGPVISKIVLPNQSRIISVSIRKPTCEYFCLGRPKGKGKSSLDQYQPEIKALWKNGSKKNFITERYISHSGYSNSTG
jgi:hypothetical protein